MKRCLSVPSLCTPGATHGQPSSLIPPRPKKTQPEGLPTHGTAPFLATTRPGGSQCVRVSDFEDGRVLESLRGPSAALSNPSAVEPKGYLVLADGSPNAARRGGFSRRRHGRDQPSRAFFRGPILEPTFASPCQRWRIRT
jgi:hypothetical protein